MTVAELANKVQRRAERLALKRVILLDKPTVPPRSEEIWGRAWYVVYTRPGQEWVARSELMRAGFSVFLPVVTRWAPSRYRTKRQVERSLLTRYIFAGIRGGQIGVEDWSAILNTEGVQTILGDEAGPIAAPVENVMTLAGEQVSGAFDETGMSFEAGETVKIARGPFATFLARIETSVPKEAAPDDAIEVVMSLMGRDTIAHIALADLQRIA